MRERGITLIEMMLVTALIALMAGISFPAVSAGIESVRLRTSCDSLAAFLNYGMTTGERRQETVFLLVERERRNLRWNNRDGKEIKSLELPPGVKIAAIEPEPPFEAGQERIIPMMPGAPFPSIQFVLENKRGNKRKVKIDPVQGVPEVVAP